MRYDEIAALDRVYHLVAELFEKDVAPERAMAISDALISLGEESSWASVWWAYGAVHFELSDEAYARALRHLQKVDRSPEVRAAALMLTAEIELTSAIDNGREADVGRQVRLLTEAAALAPHWPEIHLRVARAAAATGDLNGATTHGLAALDLLAEGQSSHDLFDDAISGASRDLIKVAVELQEIGLDDIVPNTHSSN